eukprot:2087396-Amphidinium_carterae.1
MPMNDIRPTGLEAIQESLQRVMEAGDVLVEKFPMWVMQLSHALALTSLEPYEAQREAGAISMMQTGMLVSFISHQWLGLSQPDQNMEQFKDFQT